MDPEDERELAKLKREKRKAEKKDNLKEVSQIHNCIGELLSKYERFEEAIKEHEAERAISEALQDAIGEAVACRKIGECYCALEQYPKALKLQERHLSLAKSCDSAIEEQRAWATIGRTYLFQSETSKGRGAVDASKNAESAFQKSLEVCERLKNSVKNEELMEMKARLYLNLGLVYDGRGNVRQSAEFMKRAITIAQKYRLQSDVYRCQFSLAGMYQRSENWSQALRSLEEAQQCASKLKDKLLESEVLVNKAQVLVRIGDYSMGKHCLKKAYKLGSATVTDQTRILKMFKSASKMEECTDELQKEDASLQQQFKLYEMLGDAAADAANFKQAIDFYLQMLSCGDQLLISKKERIPIYVSLAQTFVDNKQFAEAVEYYKKELACRSDDPEQVCRTWLNIAEAEELGGSSYEKISQCYLSAFEFARKAKNRKLQIQVLKSLVEVQKIFKQKTHQQQTEDKLLKLRNKYGISDEDELSDSELDTQHSEEDGNLSIAELTESDCSDEELSAPGTTGSVRRRVQTKPKVNEKGETPLHRACIEGNLKKVSTLLEKGHPVNPRDYCGWIPLHEAANHDHYEVVKCLLEHGAAVNDRGGKHCGGITPLIDAANCGNTEIMKILLHHGANVHNKDDDGQTALDCLRAWYQRCEDTLSREVQLSYSHIEAMLSGGLKGGQMPRSNTRPLDRSRPPALLDLYDDDSSRESQTLPEVKVTVKRKRTSTGGSKSSRAVIASDSEEGGSDQEVSLLPETDSQDFYPNPRLEDLGPHSSATDNYRHAMSGIGSASQRAAVRGSVYDKSATPKTHTDSSALLDADHFVGDDWLIDDIQPQKRKKLDIGGVFSTSGSRKSTDSKRQKCDTSRRKSFVIDDDVDDDSGASDNRMEAAPSNLDVLSVDDFTEDFVMSSFSVNSDSIVQSQSSANRSKLSTKTKPRQMKLTNFTTQENRSTQRSFSGFQRENIDEFGPSQNGFSTTTDHEGTGLPQSTHQNETLTSTGVMRLKVTIDGQMLLVPIPDINQSISWLAQDVSRRYEKIHQKKPLVTLRTRDGAILSPDDVVCMVLSNNEVVDAVVDSWDMQPLHDRYRQACRLTRAVEYRNIVSLLQSCDSTGCLSLRNLALRSNQIHPVCRALEGQNNMKHLDLQSNRLGDNGMSVLSRSVCSLPGLTYLNVCGNDITTVGLKSFTDTLQAGQQSGSRPLQSLVTLVYSHNSMGDNSTNYLATLLSCLPSLTDLSVSACQLTAKFFSQHRLALADAMQASNLQKLDVSHNRLGSLGLEQLLKCLNHRRMTTLNLSETHAGTSVSHLTLHLQQYLTQDGCILEDLHLSACHFTSDDGYFVTRVPSLYKGLKRLDISCNTKVDNSVIQELLQESGKNNCSLEEVLAQGCAIKSPLDSNFLDAVNDKLSNTLHPLRGLVFTCSHLDKVDVECLHQIWLDRWKELANIDITGEYVRLGVLDSS
ncbi:tonsoku-like protein [Haliotis cracherodii]|uniref:tonsoku-like protein n=1 Tax=Haliotis cracherodii TaxID=6455 RepID=UPI0039E932CF